MEIGQNILIFNQTIILIYIYVTVHALRLSLNSRYNFVCVYNWLSKWILHHVKYTLYYIFNIINLLCLCSSACVDLYTGSHLEYPHVQVAWILKDNLELYRRAFSWLSKIVVGIQYKWNRRECLWVKGLWTFFLPQFFRIASILTFQLTFNTQW